METVKLLLTLVVLLVIIILVLVSRILKYRKNIHDILLDLDDIEKGNENRKILAKESDAAAEICFKINSIVANNKARIIEFKSSEKAYKQLLTNLSHDVRTPLASLIGYLDAICSNVVDGDEKESYIGIARNKAYMLKELIDMLFEWFKLDARERVFQFENCDVNELTRNILIDWIPFFDKSRIEYYISIPESECPISLDTYSYTRIINNIIQNSIEHGSITQIGISIRQSHDNVIIEIWDNGKGICGKDLPNIFDRLYKCDESRSHKGTGLGLSIVKELVNAHKGKITAESIPDIKTTFTISLPNIRLH